MEARDPEANAVILSGDLNGDDVFGDFATNRSDNVMNVMTIGAGVTRKTLIEGFTIKGGNAYGAALPQLSVGEPQPTNPAGTIAVLQPAMFGTKAYAVIGVVRNYFFYSWLCS